MQPFKKYLAAPIFLLLLSACTVGPHYKKPIVDVPAHYKETPNGWKKAEPNDTSNRGEWWKVFHDPTLDTLETKLTESNQNIAVAYAQYRQACALVDEARASLFPTLSGTISLNRQRQASNGTSFISTSSSGTTSTGSAVTSNKTSSSSVVTSHAWSLNALWEPDLWGSVRRTIEANTSGAEASAAQLASVRLSSQATLAQTYFQLRATDKDQQLLNDTVTDYQKSLKLTQHRYTAGVVSRTDVIQAETQLETARAQAISNRLTRAQFEHAIAVLLGEPPENISIPAKPLSAKPPLIPVTVPSVLLERRPDVAQAERLANEANAQIGVAISAYFPTLSLSAIASEAHQNYSHWFFIPAMNWTLGSQLAETILDGGLRSATVAAARANYEATVATYKQTVLAAFQEVEDNLASERILKQQSIELEKSAIDAHRALQLVINQYKSGTAQYSDVITAQTTAYTAEKAAADMRGQRMTSAVSLIKALGGGWNADFLHLCSGISPC